VGSWLVIYGQDATIPRGVDTVEEAIGVDPCNAKPAALAGHETVVKCPP